MNRSSYSFTVLGRPAGKQRPLFVRRGKFTKAITREMTVNYENTIKEEFVRQCDPDRLLDGPLGIRIECYHYIPKSTSKKKRELMISHSIRPTTKPDADNIMKVVCDALNGVAYGDDKQIVSWAGVKRYGEQPRVEVVIWELNEDACDGGQG